MLIHTHDDRNDEKMFDIGHLYHHKRNTQQDTVSSPIGKHAQKAQKKECDMNQVPLTSMVTGIQTPLHRIHLEQPRQFTAVGHQSHFKLNTIRSICLRTSLRQSSASQALRSISCNKPHDNTCTCTCKNHLNNADIAPLRYNTASINKQLSDTFTPRQPRSATQQSSICSHEYSQKNHNNTNA